jgi:hypothetical protein
VTVEGKAKTLLNGTITYQVCKAEMYLPHKTVAFGVAVP